MPSDSNETSKPAEKRETKIGLPLREMEPCAFWLYLIAQQLLASCEDFYGILQFHSSLDIGSTLDTQTSDVKEFVPDPQLLHLLRPHDLTLVGQLELVDTL